MGASHGWVPVDTHSTPVPSSKGRLWVPRHSSTAPNKMSQNSDMVAELVGWTQFQSLSSLFPRTRKEWDGVSVSSRVAAATSIRVPGQRSAPQVRRRGQGGRESLSAETNSHQRAITIQMIQKTDEFTDAVQGEGCGCAGCDAMTVTAEGKRSRLQFLNRVDDVQVVLTMNALVRSLSGTVVQGVEGGCWDAFRNSRWRLTSLQESRSTLTSTWSVFWPGMVATWRKTQWLSTMRRVRSQSWSWGVPISSTTRLITSWCVQFPVRRTVRQERWSGQTMIQHRADWGAVVRNEAHRSSTMGPKAHSAIMFFNSVTRAMGTNAVAEFLRRAPQEDSLPRQWFPQPRFRRESMCNSERLETRSHRWSLELIPMQRMLMQFKHRVLEVADEVTMVASRADKSCAMVSSLTEGVQQREESRQHCRMWSWSWEAQRDRGNGADQRKVAKGKTDRKRWRRQLRSRAEHCKRSENS